MERLPWRFTMRRMSGALNEGHLHRAIALFLRNLDLADGPILVVFALNERDWDADIGEIVGNIPGAEFWIEPGAVPAIEGVVDVRMPAREPLAEAGIFISLLDFGDRGDRDVLDYEMRGDQREAVEPVVRNAAGVDRSDRGAVGTAAAASPARTRHSPRANRRTRRRWSQPAALEENLPTARLSRALHAA